MTKEEIMVLDIEQIESRAAEIAEETATADAETLELLNAELDSINERRTVLKEEIEQRKMDMSDVINGKGTVLDKITERKEEKMEIRNTPEYINAYADYLKTGNDMECRALLSENATGGTVAVPDMVAEYIRNAWDNEGIMQYVRKTYLRGNLKVGFEISATDAEIHEEGEEVDEEALVLGIAELKAESIKKWISISDEAYDLTGSDFIAYIYDEIAQKIAKAAADALIAKIIAAGTTSTASVPAVPVVDAGTITVGLIATALGLLSDQAARPIVVMNKATWSAFKAAQYAASYPVDVFEGLEVRFNNSMKSYAAAADGETYAIVGDFGYGAQANFPNGEGITFKFDDLTLATSDLIRIIGREFVGLGVVAPNAFVKITK